MVAVAFLSLRGLRGHCVTPLVCAEARFLLCFVGLGISYFPYIIPPSNAIWQAAAPASSQGFLPIGTVTMIPTILPYMACSYWTFVGKVEPGAHRH
jgi:cytochrome d ubiquinol oxidase subunit II